MKLWWCFVVGYVAVVAVIVALQVVGYVLARRIARAYGKPIAVELTRDGAPYKLTWWDRAWLVLDVVLWPMTLVSMLRSIQKGETTVTLPSREELNRAFDAARAVEEYEELLRIREGTHDPDEIADVDAELGLAWLRLPVEARERFQREGSE